MSGAKKLLRDIRPLPGDAMLTVRYVREMLAAGDEAESADPTVEVVAEELGRSPSTVRGWCPKIPGAYRAAGREWRIPRVGLRRFLEGKAQRTPTAGPPAGAESRLRAWRPDAA